MNENAPTGDTPTPETQEQTTLQPTTAQPPQGNLFDGGEKKLYAGKYKSVEELEKAYGEAQKVIGKKAPEKQTPSGPSLSDIGQRFQQQLSSGTFDDDVSTALSQFGLTPDMVSNAFAAERQTRRAKVNEAMGEQVDWDTVNNWLLENKSQQEIDALNRATEAGLYGALKDVVAEFNAAKDVEPAKVGTPPRDGSMTSGGFKNAEEARDFLKSTRMLAKPDAVAEWESRLAATPDHIRKQLLPNR